MKRRDAHSVVFLLILNAAPAKRLQSIFGSKTCVKVAVLSEIGLPLFFVLFVLFAVHDYRRCPLVGILSVCETLASINSRVSSK